MQNILPSTPTLIALAMAVAACVDTTTSTCADGARCPTGDLCVEQPDGPVCVPAARVHDCTNKNEGDLCRYDEMSPPAVCRAGICALMECGNGYEDWGEICDDGNLDDADGCSRDCLLPCGDGIVQYDNDEVCDVKVPLSESCLDRGFDMGTLTCTSSCQDVSAMSCIDFDWQPMQGVPDDWHFARVWVFSPEHAVALGARGELPPLSLEDYLLWLSYGDIFEYDGTSWHLSEEAVPTLSNLWADGPEDIYAVGALGNIWRYNGKAWSRMSVDSSYHFGAIWGTSSDNLFAVGAYWQPWLDLPGLPDPPPPRPAILRFDGNAWTPMVLPEGDSPGNRHGLLGIWGSGADNVFAVGSYGTILHYDGNPDGIWTLMDVPPSIGADQIFLDVWGTGATDVTVVGDQGTILRYDGHEWSPMNSPTNQALTGIWGTPEGRMFAVGLQGTLLGYDPLAGTEWRTMESGTMSELTAIHGSSAENILAVGVHGAVVRLGQSAWAAMDLQGNQKAVNQIWGSGLDCMYAVDQGGQIWHYDGNPSWRWTLMRPTERKYRWARWSDVHGLGCDGQIFVVGSARPALRYQDGTWLEMQGTESVDTLDLQAVWAAGPDAVFAVGRGGTILRYDGNQELRWAPMDSGVDALLTAVWGTAPDNVFAVSNEGTILHYDGNSKGTWTRMSSGVDRVLNALWGTGPDNVFAVGETTILHYDGKDWTPMAFPILGGTLQAIWGSSARHVFAASETGGLYHYDGTQWSPMRSPTDVTIPSIWGTPDGKHIFVADTLGHIFRLTLPPAALPAD